MCPGNNIFLCDSKSLKSIFRIFQIKHFALKSKSSFNIENVQSNKQYSILSGERTHKLFLNYPCFITFKLIEK